MKRVIKIFLGLVATLLVLAAGLAIAVAVLFDPKEFTPLLAQSVEKATGRKLTLGGDIKLDYFPCCSVRLGQAALGNPPGFPAGDFVSARDIDLSIRIWPLLTERRIEIGVVTIDGLEASLLVNKAGVSNWDFAAQDGKGEAPETAGDAPAAAFSIGGIRIRDAQVIYRDEDVDTAYRAEKLQLETGPLAAAAPFDLRLSTYFTEESGSLAGNLALQSGASFDTDAARLALNKLLIDFDLGGSAIPAKSLRGKLAAAGATLDAQQDTRLHFMRLEGEFAAPGLASPAGDASGSFSAAEVSLAVGASSELIIPALQADLAVKGKSIPGGSLAAKLAVDGLEFDIDKMVGAVRAFDVDANGLGAHFALKGGGRLGDRGADLAGTLKLDPVSPRSLLAALGESVPHTADPQVLTRLAGTAGWSLGKDLLDLKNLDFQLDDSRFTGSLGVRNFDKPLTRFDLRVSQLDLDRYLAPEEAPGGASAKAGAGAARGGDDIPVATLRDLRLDGRIAVGQLVFAKTRLSDVSATVQADGGRVRIDPLAAQLYGGSYRGSIGIDASGPKARVTLDQQLTALQVGTVLKDRYQTDSLAGALSGRITASGSGNNSDDILATLAGNVALSLADGAYQGTDLWHEIRSARARLKGEPLPPAPESPRTPLNAVELGGTLVDGVLKTNRLLAEIPFIRLTGTGGMNLVARSMNYALQAQVFENPTFEDGTTIKDLKGLSIPLTVKGPLDEPKVGVDLKNMLGEVATQKLKERLLKKLGGDDDRPAVPALPDEAAQSGAPGESAGPAAEPQKKEKPRDVLKRGLRDLLKPAPEPQPEP